MSAKSSTRRNVTVPRNWTKEPMAMQEKIAISNSSTKPRAGTHKDVYATSIIAAVASAM